MKSEKLTHTKAGINLLVLHHAYEEATLLHLSRTVSLPQQILSNLPTKLGKKNLQNTFFKWKNIVKHVTCTLSEPINDTYTKSTTKVEKHNQHCAVGSKLK